MADNLDSDDIRRFLQNYRSGAHAYGQAPYDGHGQAPYVGYGTDPRWAPPVTHRDVLVLDEPDDSPFDETQSEYMAAPSTTASAATSRAAHTMRSGASSSIFSYRTDGGLSSVGQSTAPSEGVARPSFVQQFFGGALPPQPNHHDSGGGGGGGGELWCEFSGLLHCPATFALDDEAGWIAHHAAHLGHQFPAELMCWFCDGDDKHAKHAPFVAAGPADRRANFERRMRHVRRHVINGDGQLTSAHARPDFGVVSHLRQLGRLSEDMYRHAMAYDETPVQFRLPTWSQPHPSESSSSSGAAGGSRWQYHDLDKERRERRREEQQERRKEEEERKEEARRKDEKRKKEERRKEEERRRHGRGGGRW